MRRKPASAALLVIAAFGLLGTLPVTVPAAGSWLGDGRMAAISPHAAFQIQGFQPTNTNAANQPPGTEARSLTIAKQGGAYVATIGFASSFSLVTVQDGLPVDHAVLLRLTSPSGVSSYTGLLSSVDHKALGIFLGQAPQTSPGEVSV
ncbi:MAG TPA: hypothetical protein VF134_07310, partial [Candidatus Dormibacteraeota bacterium]